MWRACGRPARKLAPPRITMRAHLWRCIRSGPFGPSRGGSRHGPSCTLAAKTFCCRQKILAEVLSSTVCGICDDIHAPHELSARHFDTLLASADPIARIADWTGIRQ